MRGDPLSVSTPEAPPGDPRRGFFFGGEWDESSSRGGLLQMPVMLSTLTACPWFAGRLILGSFAMCIVGLFLSSPRG